MRFLSIYHPRTIKAPTPEGMQAMQAFCREAIQKGVLLATEGVDCSDAAAGKDARATLDRGEFNVTDGPFSEAKELIGGFAIMQVASREEMMLWTRRFLEIAGDGECEIHQLSDVSAMDFLGGAAGGEKR